jgi:CheY-like chemotaxis protein
MESRSQGATPFHAKDAGRRPLSRGRRSQASILIVEDEGLIRNELADELRDQGFKVAVASNGSDAMAWLERGLGPSVILLDLVMPVMDGWEFRGKQLADPRFASIPVVLVSGTAESSDEVSALRPHRVVRKPYGLDTLLDVLDECGGATER